MGINGVIWELQLSNAPRATWGQSPSLLETLLLRAPTGDAKPAPAALPSAKHLPLPVHLRAREMPEGLWGELSPWLGDAQPLGRAAAVIPVTLPEGSCCNPHSRSSSRRSPVLGTIDPPEQSGVRLPRDTTAASASGAQVAPSVPRLQRDHRGHCDLISCDAEPGRALKPRTPKRFLRGNLSGWEEPALL